MPPPSTSRWCLLPARPRSTGLGPVLEPPFSLAGDWNRRSPAPTRVGRRRAAPRARARESLPDTGLFATLAAARPGRSSRKPNAKLLPAGAPSRSPCASTPTRSPATRAGHQAACDPDNGSAPLPRRAATARSAPTTASAATSHGLALIDIPPSLTSDAASTSRPPTGPFIQYRFLALQFGHQDGGELVRTRYGHPDAVIARARP